MLFMFCILPLRAKHLDQSFYLEINVSYNPILQGNLNSDSCQINNRANVGYYNSDGNTNNEAMQQAQ